ncbi:ATP-binding protein [Actinomadura terrae]|uniref:ATP-binding protein n=1 Tax=Actinomadura terrae TaxID=604353 RepID=UPI001FA80F99|nr:ATP-binding protein [Actinomadura terrae]
MGTKELGIDDPGGGATGERAGHDHHHAAWELAAETRAAARARTLTARALHDWRVTAPADVDDIILMVDELVTNAIVHGTGPVRLALTLDGPVLTGRIGDNDPAAPAAPGGPPRVLDWAEAGRGLLLVTALATEFGAHPDGTGKTVWFTRLLTPLNGHSTN